MIILDKFGLLQETKTYINNMNTPPDSFFAKAYNNFIKSCINAGNWNLIDAMWIHATHAQQAGRLNLKSPGTYTITEVNSPTWTAKQGYTGNASNMYLNTGWNPSTNGVNFTQNSASCGVYCRTNSQANVFDMGAIGAGTRTIEIRARSTTDTTGFALTAGNTQSTVSNANSLGLISFTRTESANFIIYRNGSSLGTVTNTSAAPASQNVFILARNSSGTADSYSGREISFSFVGGGGVDHLLLFNAIEEYMDTLGTGVV